MAKELDKLTVAAAAKTFGNIGRDRTGRLPNVVSEPEVPGQNPRPLMA